MKTLKRVIAAVVFLFTSIQLQAQDSTDATQIIRPVHISFVTPLSTNGLEAGKVTNRVSLNMIAGYSGGLKGVEIGGFANALKGDMEGVQLAGFSNINKGTVIGVQIAGFNNLSHSTTKGAQIAGFANIVNDSAKAIQLAGFTNIVKGDVEGAQMSGFANATDGDFTGAQLTGFANLNKGDLKGLQIAGFSNINKGDLKGVQIAGFVNQASKVSGLQLGFINIADTVEKGVSFGFISWVKKGYRAFEISGNETLSGVVSFKTGTKTFYNIISLGASRKEKTNYYAYGYGIGTMIPLKNKMSISIEGVSYQISDGKSWGKHLNLLNKLQISAAIPITQKLSAFVGASWNVNVADATEIDGHILETPLIPWSSWEHQGDNNIVTMYPGFQVGLRL